MTPRSRIASSASNKAPSAAQSGGAKTNYIDRQRRRVASRRFGGTPPRQLWALLEAFKLVKETGADLRYHVALTGLLIASSGRIPPQLATDLLAVNDAPTRERSTALAAAIENSLWVFDEVCGQPYENVLDKALSSVSRGEPDRSDADYRGELARHVWRECRFERYSLLASEAEFVEISRRTGPEPMLAHFIFGYLDAHGGAHLLEVRLLREIALGNPYPLEEG